VRKRRIVVVGYPKSGTTWVTRLTAQLLDAPIKGFWREPASDEIAIEGTARVSPFEVFKSHHTYREIRHDVDVRDIIYVVRDVRDVAVSGACYFSFRPRRPLARLAYSLRKRMAGATSKLGEPGDRLREMLRVLAEGDTRPNLWCPQPWDRHIAAFIDARAFIVRYEDLLAAPERECSRLLLHLGVERLPAHIRAAVTAQSFASAKRRFVEVGDLRRARFLRQGRSGAWTTELSAEQSAFCLLRFGLLLSQLDYEPSTIADAPYARTAHHDSYPALASDVSAM
jgi:hypothetical protein